jgi:SAM-dependent methyltransferase
VHLLRTVEGEAALAVAAQVTLADPLAAATTLRAAGFGPELASAALTQAGLRRRAEAKFGADAAHMLFTRAGLEQATRAVVARRRAARLAAAGVNRVADLGCGLGADAIAFARAGLSVYAVDADPVTAELAEANAAALGLADRITVACQDATTVELSRVDAVFCDPSRRDVAAGRRVFDPAAYSPPWPFVIGLAERVPKTVLKLGPGIDHALLPRSSEAEAEWVSVDGDVVEAAVWCGPLATVPHRATVLRGSDVRELTGTGVLSAPVGGLRPYLFDPDGAVVRSHLVAEFADQVGGSLADPRIAYVFADAPVQTPLGRCFEVVEELPFPLKHLRKALRERDIGRLEIRKRGVAVEPDRLRRELKLAGRSGATLVLLRVGDTPTALLCHGRSAE